MAKLKARGALSVTPNTEKRSDKPQAITTVKKKVTTSYNVPPLTLRMSLNDKKAIGDWVNQTDQQDELIWCITYVIHPSRGCA